MVLSQHTGAGWNLPCMAARCNSMDASAVPPRRRHASYRGACLALGALCLLAALAGTVARSGPAAHHRSHAPAAAAVGYDLAGAGHRTGVDATLAARAAATATGARPAAVVGSAPEPRRHALGSVRTRGPPATA